MKNVLLITIDALRADHLPFLGYHRNTSPYLNEIASEGATFPLAFANSSFTWASFPALFSSDYPVKGDKYTIEDRLTIQEVLQSHGYQTVAFHSNPYLSRYYGYDKGFDYFEDYLKKPRMLESRSGRSYLRRAVGLARGIRAKNSLVYNLSSPIWKRVNPERLGASYVNGVNLTKDVLNYMKAQPVKPTFLWVHYMDVHGPPIYPATKFEIETLRENGAKPFPMPICRGYYNELLEKYDYRIRFADYAISRLLIGLGSFVDDSLLIITADHGDEFYDHGDIGHRPKLYDELIHVPLIISGKGIKSQRSEDLVQHLDIAPTILNWLGLDVPKGFKGQNVFDIKDREAVISEVASNLESVDIAPSQLMVSYRTKKWKYIYKRNLDHEAYDLVNDPSERVNIRWRSHEVDGLLWPKVREYVQTK